MDSRRVWYSPNTDLKSPDAIHQILMFGTLDEIHQLKKALGRETLKNTFLTYPKKVYTKPALSFTTRFILHISTPIDEQKYLKDTRRDLRQ